MKSNNRLAFDFEKNYFQIIIDLNTTAKPTIFIRVHFYEKGSYSKIAERNQRRK